MIIKYPRLEIELSKDEAIEIFYDVKESIKLSIQKHWINHPDCFLRSEATKLGILRELSKIANYNYDTQLLPEFLGMLKKEGKP